MPLSAQRPDLFELLPDSLVDAILCKVGVGCIKSLSRCKAVCKRWNLLCPFGVKLVFDCRELPTCKWKVTEPVLSSHMFRVRSLNAPGVDLLPCLEQLSARLDLEFHGRVRPCNAGKVLPDKVCFQRLVHLSITAGRGCIPDEEEPSCFMPCLTSCEFGQLHNTRWIEKFVQLSPLLKLWMCWYIRATLCIASQNLETLVVWRCYCDCLEVEAPRLVHLEILNVEKLVVSAQALHEFVLWNNDWRKTPKIEFGSMPRVSRWIFMDGYKHYVGYRWTCKEIIDVLESAKGIEIGHVQLPLLRCSGSNDGVHLDALHHPFNVAATVAFPL